MPSLRTPPHPHASRPAWCLSLHAGYRCRHSGACCTAGWPIPAEPPVAEAIRLHFGRRGDASLQAAASPDHLPVLGSTSDGACVFYDGRGGRLCEIHRDLGEPFLPGACRHFPRVVLIDARGTFVTLSHFCPTAAGLLFAAGGPSVVEAPGTLTLDGTVEGLDATAALPPLLREGMLTDLDGYDAWERAGVAVLGAAAGHADAALCRRAASTRAVSRWSPADGPLRECVSRVFANQVPPDDPPDHLLDADLAALALASVPAELSVPDILVRADAASIDPADAWSRFDDVIRRYLAARLFGNWWGYLGLDLGGVVTALRAHRALLRRQLARRLPASDPREALLEAIRDTDLVMLHLSDQRHLARLLRHRR